MMPVNHPKKKLGQVVLIKFLQKIYSLGGPKQYSFQGGQYSLTQPVTLHTSMKMTMDHMDPVTGVTNKGLSPGIHAVICLTVLIVIGH